MGVPDPAGRAYDVSPDTLVGWGGLLASDFHSSLRQIPRLTSTVGHHNYVSSYFYCRIQLEGMLYDAGRELSLIAKFLVVVECNSFKSKITSFIILMRFVDKLVMASSIWASRTV